MPFVVFIRVKMLKEVPYTPEEAERAAGMGSYTLMSTKPLLPVDQDEEMISSENVESAAGTWKNNKLPAFCSDMICDFLYITFKYM